MAAASKGAASLSPLKRAEAELTKLNDAIFGESASGAAAPAPGSDYEGQRHRAAAAAAPLTTKGAVSAREILAAGGSRSARAGPAGPSPQGRGRGRANKGAAAAVAHKAAASGLPQPAPVAAAQGVPTSGGQAPATAADAWSRGDWVRGPADGADGVPVGGDPAGAPPGGGGGSPADLAAGADDLEDMLAAWRAVGDATYAGMSPCGTLTITVLAGRGLPAAEPTWVAHCAGQSSSGGPARSYYIVPSQPGGPAGGSAPSWSSEPLMLPLYDHTADLALFLCDGAAAGRGTVARAVVPLTQLLPRNPLRKPQPLQAWVALFPTAAEGDPPGSCALKYAEAVPDAAGRAMAMPTPTPMAAPPAPAQGGGAVLVKIEMHLHRSVLGAHLLCPPFDASAVAARDPHTGGAVLPPEEVHRTLLRLREAATSPPELLLACGTAPLLGLLLLVPLGWLLYATSLTMLPWWLLVAWSANGVARRRRLAARAPNPWEPTPRSDLEPRGSATATDKLQALRRAVTPLLTAAAALASTYERLLELPAAADRATVLLCLLPALCAAALASLVLGVCGGAVWLVGGVANLLMGAASVAALLNLVRHYRDAILSWAGAGGAAAAGEGAPPSRARSPTKRRPGEGGAEHLLPPGGVDSTDAQDLETPMSPEKAVAGLFKGASSLTSAWEETSAKATELAQRPTAQRLIRATAAIATNLWRRLPDRLEVTHRAIARAAIRSEVAGAPLPTASPRAAVPQIDAFSA